MRWWFWRAKVEAMVGEKCKRGEKELHFIL